MQYLQKHLVLQDNSILLLHQDHLTTAILRYLNSHLEAVLSLLSFLRHLYRVFFFVLRTYYTTHYIFEGKISLLESVHSSLLFRKPSSATDLSQFLLLISFFAFPCSITQSFTMAFASSPFLAALMPTDFLASDTDIIWGLKPNEVYAR